MKNMKYIHLLAAAAATTPALMAGTDTWFAPLTESAPVVAPNELEELSAPWVAPEGISQVNILSLREVEDEVLSPGQSVVRAANAGRNASMFDMLAYDPTGSYLFIPHESPWGAGVSRLSIYSRFNEVLLAGDGQGENGDWSNDYAAFDPCRWTPNGTLFLGEEWSGTGRLVEVLNPMAPTEEVESRTLETIANVSHEGINFSKKFDDTIYYVDEWNSGSIYKFVMSQSGDYTHGQTFVLSVYGFVPTGGVAEDYWNEQASGVVRTGAATWVPLTDINGTPLPGVTDPFLDGPTNDPRSASNTRGGRPAADDVNATPYGRPEDMSVGTLANGNEVLYFTATSERSVYGIEILEHPSYNASAIPPQFRWIVQAYPWLFESRPTGEAMVHTFVSPATPTNLGHAPTTGTLNSPDNLALDALGNIYIIEDAPNSSSTGGDIWFCRDVNGDGIAESIDHFLSIRVNGSEATGMIFNPANPVEFCVAVQHPESTNLDSVPEGLGDAVWMFDLTYVPDTKFVDDLIAAGSQGITE